MTAEDQLRLRPVQPADLDYFDRWLDRDSDPFNFFGFKTTIGYRQQFAETGMLSPDGGLLLVVVADTVVGDVGWHPEHYGPPPNTAYNIGIRLLPEHRGRGHGGPAQRMLADYLLATYPVNRIEAGTDVTNRAEQRALEKAGFSREGVLRGAQWRAGGWHDLVVFSRLRGDD